MHSKEGKNESSLYFVLSSFPALVNIHCKTHFFPEINHREGKEEKKIMQEMEKYSTVELVRDKESSSLILGREAERKVKKINTFLGEKEGR